LRIKLENEIVVKKKGQTTIPAKTRRKFKIDEGTRLQLIETEDSIILKPKKSFWDMWGAYSEFGTPEEVKKDLDKLRYEDE
jgi:AbrB family looped-hinge helix DNA binding protein